MIPLLAFVFTASWFITTAVAAHLARALQATGVGLPSAVMVGACVGPAQGAGRLLEFDLLRRVNPLTTARIATLAHPVGVAMRHVVGWPRASAFAVLHGAGNGGPHLSERSVGGHMTVDKSDNTDEVKV